MPLGEAGGGLVNAFVGSLIMVAIASAWGILLGVGAGIYLAESAGGRVGVSIRFVADVLSGMPSVVACWSCFSRSGGGNSWPHSGQTL